MTAASPKPGAPDVRSAKRRLVSLSAFAREVDPSLIEVRIHDISTDGCRLKCEARFEPATPIWLKIPGITPRRAKIRWSNAFGAGCEFDSPISDATVEEVSTTGSADGCSS